MVEVLMLTNTQLNNTLYQGRLGNQMHVIASIIGIAQRSGTDFSFPVWPYAKFFKNFESSVIQYSDSNFLNWDKYKYEGMTYRNIELDPFRNYDIQGYFQNEKYWIDSIDFIRHIFTPNFKVMTVFQDKVAIHVRRGDYLDRKGFHTCLSETDYYENAIDLFPSSTEYLVFSDDIDWCKTYFNHERFTFVDPGTDYLDLFLMAQCKSFIIANSSYSWWGARLHELLFGECKVVAPSDWLVTWKEDVIPDRWIKV
jgi:hypothetical protein